jgi:hypothetical protein
LSGQDSIAYPGRPITCRKRRQMDALTRPTILPGHAMRWRCSQWGLGVTLFARRRRRLRNSELARQLACLVGKDRPTGKYELLRIVEDVPTSVRTEILFVCLSTPLSLSLSRFLSLAPGVTSSSPAASAHRYVALRLRLYPGSGPCLGRRNTRHQQSNDDGVIPSRLGPLHADPRA